MKCTLHDILKQELQTQIKENEDMMNDEEEIKRHEKFYAMFANKLVIFDPLDRPIPKEGEN